MMISSEKRQLIQYGCHTRTHKGQRSENQDACGHWQDECWLIGVVADGAGGHAAGRLASSLAVHEMLNLFRAAPTSDLSVLRQMVYEVNEALLSRESLDSNCRGMHTTLVVVVLDKESGSGVHLHAGDSRLYSLNVNGACLLTEDHSMRNLLRQSDTTIEQATSRHTLYSALGEPSNSLRIDVEILPASKNLHSLILCTDGFWEFWLQIDPEFSIPWPLTREAVDNIFDYMESNQPSRCDNFSVLAIYPCQEECM